MDDILANRESLFDVEWGVTDWPPHERFPLNTSRQHVKELVFSDLLCSSNPLIITGYTSLPLIIEFLARISTPGPVKTVRLLFGNEPAPGSPVQQFQLPGYRLDREIADYWLQKGISLTLSTKVILAIELVKQQRVLAKLAQNNRPLHAKIYCGDEGVILGSSNFSYFGLVKQIEANVRFTRQEQTRFAETWNIAEQIWQMGNDYTKQLLQLLENLLHMVTWQEALARACGEVLEGKWAQQYLQNWHFSDTVPLWPTQEQGIAQAMWIIEHTGSVLIADATGSGKTQQ